mmetsp:Transcript_14400/g.40468  ORF Transcript_14400/g.40468 Transcript_14400/m.40468 type:complete len:949 (+) Transcript_14400:37-2883(+)
MPLSLSLPPPSLLEPLEASRVLASEAKRKSQRLKGALAASHAPQPPNSQTDRSSSTSTGAPAPHGDSEALAGARAELESAHARLRSLLQQMDAGDLFSRARRDVAEAEGMVDYVRSILPLRLYREAVEGEEKEARRKLEGLAKQKAELSGAKARLAYCQGVLYAMLEGKGVQPEWEEEVAKAQAVVEEQQPQLKRRRELLAAAHKAQGERKAAERFGAILGLPPAAVRSLQLDVLLHDAALLRESAKARLKALHEHHSAREAARWEMQCTLGAIAFLTELGAMGEVQRGDSAGLLSFLAAEEYESSLEVSVLRESLAQLAPRAAEALRLRFAWHSAAGEHSVAQAIGGAEEEEAADLKLKNAQANAAAVDHVRREHDVLEGKLGKLEGKIQVIQALKSSAVSAAAAVAPLLNSSKIKVIRLNAKLGGLDILLTRYEKTQANLHAAGGALISIRRIQRAATLRPLQEPRPFGDADGDVAASGAVAPFSPAVSSMTSTSTLTTGGLTAEIRGFLRNSFAPMIRAAFEHLLADQAKDPLGYLAQWFWMHSELNTKHVRVADHRSDKVKIETLRSQVLATRAELLEVTRRIGATLPPEQQLRAADAMLRNLQLPLPNAEGQSAPYYASGTGYARSTAREDSALAGHFIRFAPPGTAPDGNDVTVSPSGIFFAPHSAANSQLLDAIASVMLQYPVVTLRIAIDEESIATNGDVDAATAADIAQRRAAAVASAVVQRSVPSHRVAACVVPSRSGQRPQLELVVDVNSQPVTFPSSNARETLPSAGTPASSDPAAEAVAQSAMARKVERHDVLLHAIRSQYRELRAEASAALHLGAPLLLSVEVTQVKLLSTVNVAGADDLAICIAFGLERANQQSQASFRITDTSVDEVDIELWDKSRSRLLSACTFPVDALLSRKQMALAGEIPIVAGYGGCAGVNAKESLGSLHIEVEAREA